jgi:hypothetical protein
LVWFRKLPIHLYPPLLPNATAEINGRPPYRRLLRIKLSDRDFSEKPRSREFSRQPIESKRE